MILSSVELPESNSYSSLQTLSNELLKTLNHILFSYNYTLHSQTIFIILKHLLKQFMEDYSEYCTNYKLMLLIVLNNNMANGMCLGNDELELFG